MTNLETLNRWMEIPYCRELAIEMFVAGQVHYHTNLANDDARHEEIVQVLVDIHKHDYKITTEEVERAIQSLLENNWIFVRKATKETTTYILTNTGQRLVDDITKGKDETNESDVSGDTISKV